MPDVSASNMSNAPTTLQRLLLTRSQHASTTSTLVHAPSPSMYPPPTAKAPSSYTLPKRPWRRYATDFEVILNHRYHGSGTDEDPYIVDWLNDDPEDPQRWGPAYKWFIIAGVSIATLCVALSSSAYSGGIGSLVESFDASLELLTAGISLFVVGFAFGPL
jgi:hypothetical protein